MATFVVGLCMGLLASLIIYWEWRADRRWADTFDVKLPKYHRKYFDQVLDEYRNR